MWNISLPHIISLSHFMWNTSCIRWKKSTLQCPLCITYNSCFSNISLKSYLFLIISITSYYQTIYFVLCSNTYFTHNTCPTQTKQTHSNQNTFHFCFLNSSQISVALTHLLTFDPGSLRSCCGWISESNCRSLWIHFPYHGLPTKKGQCSWKLPSWQVIGYLILAGCKWRLSTPVNHCNIANLLHSERETQHGWAYPLYLREMAVG